jgi:regulator of protease activity HflC (stomatin/prohibitin superfamily)
MSNFILLDEQKNKDYKNSEIMNYDKQFTRVIGNPIPWQQPNVHADTEEQDLINIINNGENSHMSSCDWLKASLYCMMTGIGCCYVPNNTHLIQDGEYGFTIDNGKPKILTSGWNSTMGCFNKFQLKVPINKNPIHVGPVTIVRIPQGSIGLAMDNTAPVILLPGTHCRNDGNFKYISTKSLNEQYIEFEQIKFLTVTTGNVNIYNDNGKADILPEGRYVINTPLIIVSNSLSIQQQNLKFDKHNVLLNGGINLLVEGLLTYQITDVNKLIKSMGVNSLVRSIQDITKAELSKVFASVRLEQISKISHNEAFTEKDNLDLFYDKKKEKQVEHADHIEQDIRIRICDQVKDLIKPFTDAWGVTIVNFQLESTKLTDVAYGKEYESCSLEIAKASAQLQANAAQNKVLIQKSKATADALKIQAEGEKTAQIIRAQANAEAMTIEADARNKSAETMKDDFSKQLSLIQEQVKFADKLKVGTLVLSGDSAIGKNITPFFNLQK